MIRNLQDPVGSTTMLNTVSSLRFCTLGIRGYSASLIFGFTVRVPLYSFIFFSTYTLHSTPCSYPVHTVVHTLYIHNEDLASLKSARYALLV